MSVDPETHLGELFDPMRLLAKRIARTSIELSRVEGKVHRAENLFREARGEIKNVTFFAGHHEVVVHVGVAEGTAVDQTTGFFGIGAVNLARYGGTGGEGDKPRSCDKVFHVPLPFHQSITYP